MSHGSCLVSLKLIPTVFCNSNKCKTSRGAIKLHFLSIVSDFYCRVGRKKQQKKQHSSQSNKKQGKKRSVKISRLSFHGRLFLGSSHSTD